MKNKKTLVLGASANPSRYSYLAINQLRAKGNDVVEQPGFVINIPVKPETSFQFIYRRRNW